MNYIQAIKNFEPINEQEQNDKKLILNFIEKNNDVLYRENEYAHMTSSGLIFNKNLEIGRPSVVLLNLRDVLSKDELEGMVKVDCRYFDIYNKELIV